MAFSKVVKVVGLALFAPLARGMLTPDNGLKALDAVEGALQKMLTGAKTDQVLLKLAKPVVEKIEATVHLVETGNLTKKENAAQVLGAIQALQGLQSHWQVASNASQKLSALKGDLKMKKMELEKDEDMLKVVKIEKELEEKKAQLKVLVERKQQSASHEKEEQEDLASRGEVNKLLKMAQALAGAKGKDAPAKTVNAKKVQLPKQLEGILTDMKARAAKATSELDKMDATEAKEEADLEKLADAPGKADGEIKRKMMVTALKKQHARSYKKARVVKKSQVAELNDGVKALESGDVGALQGLMKKMTKETKVLTSKSANFLHF